MRKKLLLACVLMLATRLGYAQDSSAAINTSWVGYVRDTALTYQQIITTCDSLFALAGYPDTASGASDEDGSPFVNYTRWKNFYATRLDVATLKPHNFAVAIPSSHHFGGGGGHSMHGASYSSGDCDGTSPLQSSIVTTPPTMPGWNFIGPQSVTIYPGRTVPGDYALNQHLGQVDGIVVDASNPNVVYATDAWGGLWKTTNANLAPNNTWTNLSDHMPQIAGIGITDLFVDFTASPHKLYCLVGIPEALCMYNNVNQNQYTIGIFFSLNAGATFHQMDLSAIPITEFDPIQAMQYWPGNDTSSTKYLFVATEFQIYRINITNPYAVAVDTMLDLSTVIPDDGATNRFFGFNSIGFLPANPSVMYISTNSNYTNENNSTAGLYRIPNANNCTACTLTNIPFGQSDFFSAQHTI